MFINTIITLQQKSSKSSQNFKLKTKMPPIFNKLLKSYQTLLQKNSQMNVNKLKKKTVNKKFQKNLKSSKNN